MQIGRNDSRRSDWRILYPFQSHELKITGYRMHFLDERPSKSNGSPAPTLLFVHGNPTWSFHWRELILALRSDYRCVAPDHIGCGLSDKPAQLQRLSDHIDHLDTLIEHLDLKNVTLVAQDWGGSIGLGAMLLRPDRLARIVLFNTGAFPPPYVPWRIRACRAPLFGRIAVQGANLFSLAALRMTLARRARLDSNVAAGYLAPYNSWANRRAVFGFVKDIPNSPRDATWQTLAEIESQLPSLADRPALLAWGLRDWCFRPDCLNRLIHAWPHAEVHRIADAGHWVVEDAREEIVPIVERFLASTELRSDRNAECAEVTEK